MSVNCKGPEIIEVKGMVLTMDQANEVSVEGVNKFKQIYSKLDETYKYMISFHCEPESLINAFGLIVEGYTLMLEHARDTLEKLQNIESESVVYDGWVFGSHKLLSFYISSLSAEVADTQKRHKKSYEQMTQNLKGK